MKKKFGDQFGIVARDRNREAKRSGFKSTNYLREHPFSCRTIPPTPAPTQYTRKYDALSEYDTVLENQVEELQPVIREATAVESEMAVSTTTTSLSEVIITEILSDQKRTPRI